MIPKKVTIVATDWPELELYCPNWQGMRAGMERLGIPYQFISCRPSLDVEQIIAFKPDLIIYGLLDMVKHADWRRQIRERLPNAKIVIWYGDLRNQKTGQIDADCSEVDAMFISNDAQSEFYKRKWKVPAVYYLPLGCEPLDKPQYNPKFSFDFVFIGGQIPDGAFHNRATEIEDYRINHKLTLVNSFEADTRAKIFKAMPEIYSSSKICLDISHFTDIQGYTSIRYFEIPAMWGFPLTKRFPGCEDLYPKHSRVYFESTEEAIELKNYYLSHDPERQAVLERAHKLSYNHTYDRRFAEMFAKLEG